MRVGFLSNGFGAHPTGLLTVAMFEALQSVDGIDVHLFALNADDGSAIRRRLRPATQLQDVSGRPHTQVAAGDLDRGIRVAAGHRGAHVVGTTGLAERHHWLVDAAASSVTGTTVQSYIKHWHGLESPALWMSIIAVAGGWAALSAYGRLRAGWDATPRPEAKAIFDAIIEPLATLSRVVTDSLHNGSLTRAVAIATVAITAAGLWAFAGGMHSPGTRALLPVDPVPAIGWALLMAATLGVGLLHRNRLVALLVMGVFLGGNVAIAANDTAGWCKAAADERAKTDAPNRIWAD